MSPLAHTVRVMGDRPLTEDRVHKRGPWKGVRTKGRAFGGPPTRYSPNALRATLPNKEESSSELSSLRMDVARSAFGGPPNALQPQRATGYTPKQGRILQ